MAVEEHVDHIRRAAKEARGIIRASAYFDRTSRIYTLIDTLESSALSYHREAVDLGACRDALSRTQETT